MAVRDEARQVPDDRVRLPISGQQRALATWLASAVVYKLPWQRWSTEKRWKPCGLSLCKETSLPHPNSKEVKRTRKNTLNPRGGVQPLQMCELLGTGGARIQVMTWPGWILCNWNKMPLLSGWKLRSQANIVVKCSYHAVRQDIWFKPPGAQVLSSLSDMSQKVTWKTVKILGWVS